VTDRNDPVVSAEMAAATPPLFPTSSLWGNMKKALESRHTRFPLCRGHLDNAVGPKIEVVSKGCS